MKQYDRTRTVIAKFGDKEYTTKEVDDLICGDFNTAQCLRDLCRNNEIERVKNPENKQGRHTVWRTVELREVRKPRPPREPSAKVIADDRYPWEDHTPDTESALCLGAALDAMTRNRQQGAAR